MVEKKKKNIAEKIKKFSGSIQDFVGGTTGTVKDHAGNTGIIIGKQKKYGSQTKKRPKGGWTPGA